MQKLSVFCLMVSLTVYATKDRYKHEHEAKRGMVYILNPRLATQISSLTPCLTPKLGRTAAAEELFNVDQEIDPEVLESMKKMAQTEEQARYFERKKRNEQRNELLSTLSSDPGTV